MAGLGGRKRPDLMRCERDDQDLLVEIEPGGPVLRLELVGSLAPGRQGRNRRVGTVNPVRGRTRPINLASSIEGRGLRANNRRERARALGGFAAGAEREIRNQQADTRQTRAELPSLKDRAPSPGDGPIVQ